MADDTFASRVWNALNTPLVAKKLPARAPRSERTPAPRTLRSAVQRAITQRPTTVSGDFGAANRAALYDLGAELTSPLNLVSIAAPVVRGAGPMSRLMGRAALAADVAQGVPAAAQGTREIMEGIQEGDLGHLGAGALLAGLGGSSLARALPRTGRILQAEEAFRRRPFKLDESGQLNPSHPLAGGREDFAILTSEGPRAGTPVMSVDDLAAQLGRQGYSPLRSAGVWAGQPEASLIVPGMSPEEAVALADTLQQTATITRRGLERTDDPIQRAILGGRVSVPRASIADGYTEVVDPATNVPERIVLDIPDYDASAYGSSGLRHIAPSAVLPSRPTMRIEHRTNADELLGTPVGEEVTIVPQVTSVYDKRGVKGVERKRAASFPRQYPARFYGTLGKGQVEPPVRALPGTFAADVPVKGVYDAVKDPLDLKAKVAARMAGLPGTGDPSLRGLAPSQSLATTLFEEEVAKRGFLGVNFGDLPSSIATKGWEGVYAGPTSPRTLQNLYRDQVMFFKPVQMRRTK